MFSRVQHAGQEPLAQLAQKALTQFNGGIELNDDVLACLLLSEAVYKAAEGPPVTAAAALNALLADLLAALPPGAPAPQLTAVQFSRRGAQHRYLVARGRDALYLSFMGSKQPRDLLADANVLTAQLWGVERAAQAAEAAGAPAGASSSAAAAATAAAATAAAAAAALPASAATAVAPAAHRGFLWRSRGVPVEVLFTHARRQGLRLVLCGHSMGGAVAQLCTLRLLRALHSPPPADQLRCIVFGAPAIGNVALASHVQRQGWTAHFMSVALPEDPVPRLLLQVPPSQQEQAMQPQRAPPTSAAAAARDAGAQGTESLQPGSGTAATSENGEPAEDAGTAVAATGAWRPAAVAAAALARRPLLAAGEMARIAARTALAGASTLRPSAVLPAFSHIGQLFLLLPGGLVPAAGSLAAVQPGPGSGPAPQAQAPPAQQWRQLHSMAYYRARAAALCWHQARQEQQHQGRGQQQQGPPEQQGSIPGPRLEAAPAAEVVLSRSLAPAVLARHAMARLPVVRLPPAQVQRQTVQLTVEVQGEGLECCTGATLRLPGAAAPLAAAAVSNLARQRLLAELEGTVGNSSDGGAGGAAGWLRAAAERSWAGMQHRRAQHKPPTAAGHEAPGLVLQFLVPAAAILALQLRQQQWPPQADSNAEHQAYGAAQLLPPARLVLLTDFGKAAASVQLQPRVVWLLGLDGSLAADTWDRLGSAAAAGPGAHARPWGGWRQRLPGRQGQAAAGGGPAGTASAGSPEAPGGAGGKHAAPRQDDGQPRQGDGQPRQGGQAESGSQATPPPRCSPPATQRLRRLREQLAAHLRGGLVASGHGPNLPAALLRGMLLLDTTAVLDGSNLSGMDERLEVASEALQRLAKAQAIIAAGGRAVGSNVASSSSSGGGVAASVHTVPEPELEEVEDEYLAELRHLGLAAQLRRQLAQATRVAAAQRRALGRRHRRAVALLCATPPPDALLLVLRHGDLLSTQFGEGLDAAALGAVRRLAVACRACRPAAAAVGDTPVPLLLAIASRGRLSVPYRYELATATGLADAGTDSSIHGGGGGSRYGSVVPLPLHHRGPGSTNGIGSSTDAGVAGLTEGAAVEVPQADMLLASLLSYVGRLSSPAARL